MNILSVKMIKFYYLMEKYPAKGILDIIWWSHIIGTE